MLRKRAQKWRQETECQNKHKISSYDPKTCSLDISALKNIEKSKHHQMKACAANSYEPVTTSMNSPGGAFNKNWVTILLISCCDAIVGEEHRGRVLGRENKEVSSIHHVWLCFILLWTLCTVNTRTLTQLFSLYLSEKVSLTKLSHIFWIFLFILNSVEFDQTIPFVNKVPLNNSEQWI